MALVLRTSRGRVALAANSLAGIRDITIRPLPASMSALEAGAVDAIEKPRSDETAEAFDARLLRAVSRVSNILDAGRGDHLVVLAPGQVGFTDAAVSTR